MRRQLWLLIVTVVLVVAAFAATLLGSSRPQLGLDLQGGISVVLFPVKGSDLSTLDTARQIISNRVDAIGVAEPEVNVQGSTIVINLPGAKNRSQALALVGRTAELQFREVQQFVPYSAVVGATTTTAKGATTTASGATTTAASGATTTTATATTTTAKGATTTKKGALGLRLNLQPISATRPLAASATTTTPPLTAAPVVGATTTTVAGATTTTAKGATTTAAPATTTTTLKPGSTCKSLLTPSAQIKTNESVVLPYKASKASDPQAGCYFLGPTLLTGREIGSADARYDLSQGGWYVTVHFKNNDFADKIGGPEVGKQVAIVLDGVVQSAPQINAGITGKDVQITGSFSSKEAHDLALVLRYGALPIQFDQKQQTVENVSPELGKDQLRAGLAAGLIGIGLVALYMILFYRLLGLVVWVGLILTAMIFFSLVTYLGHAQNLTLTLAGVTGIIVSVGVTVDSYVVYFERLKDEVRMGKTIRSSLDSGFRRAFRTIVAADLVSLIGAIVLYLLAVGSVRGFAYFLGISTALDLVLAYCFMHPMVWLLSRRPTLVRMKGIGIASGLDVVREMSR